MTYQQVVTPNIDVSAVLGECLNYVQRAYGLKWTGYYALDGWNKNKSNHQDRNIPCGVYVPIWFDGYWTGVRYGHVVIYKDGVCYSSPWSAVSAAAGRHDTLGSIADVERIYRMSYLGWSEDMNGQYVIKGKEEKAMVPTVDLLNALFWRFRKRHTTPAEQERYVGKISYDELIPLLNTGDEADRAARLLELGDQAEREGWLKPSDADSKVAEIKKIVNN